MQVDNKPKVDSRHKAQSLFPDHVDVKQTADEYDRIFKSRSNQTNIYTYANELKDSYLNHINSFADIMFDIEQRCDELRTNHFNYHLVKQTTERYILREFVPEEIKNIASYIMDKYISKSIDESYNIIDKLDINVQNVLYDEFKKLDENFSDKDLPINDIDTLNEKYKQFVNEVDKNLSDTEPTENSVQRTADADLYRPRQALFRPQHHRAPLRERTRRLRQAAQRHRAPRGRGGRDVHRQPQRRGRRKHRIHRAPALPPAARDRCVPRPQTVGRVCRQAPSDRRAGLCRYRKKDARRLRPRQDGRRAQLVFAVPPDRRTCRRGGRRDCLSDRHVLRRRARRGAARQIRPFVRRRHGVRSFRGVRDAQRHLRRHRHRARRAGRKSPRPAHPVRLPRHQPLSRSVLRQNVLSARRHRILRFCGKRHTTACVRIQ